MLSLSDKSWKEKGIRRKMFLGWAASLSIAWTIIITLIIYDSYGTYLDQRAFYDATVEQYAAAVTMYGDRAVIDVESAAWTDLKYQGYQDNVSDLILDLRKKITSYNIVFVKKDKMHKNPFFSWFIIDLDDDMKLVKMRTATQHLK